MNTQKFETRALSDDELDAVSGGIDICVARAGPGNQNAAAAAQRAEDDKNAAAQNQTFQQLIQQM